MNEPDYLRWLITPPADDEVPEDDNAEPNDAGVDDDCED